MKGYPGLTNLLTEEERIRKKRLVIKKWCVLENIGTNGGDRIAYHYRGQICIFKGLSTDGGDRVWDINRG